MAFTGIRAVEAEDGLIKLVIGHCSDNGLPRTLRDARHVATPDARPRPFVNNIEHSTCWPCNVPILCNKRV